MIACQGVNRDAQSLHMQDSGVALRSAALRFAAAVISLSRHQHCAMLLPRAISQ